MKPSQIRGYAAQLKGAINADQTGAEVTLDITTARAIHSLLAGMTNGLRVAKDRPAGHRWCGEPVMLTDAAVLVEYYGHRLWLPKSKVTMVDGQITSP